MPQSVFAWLKNNLNGPRYDCFNLIERSPKGGVEEPVLSLSKESMLDEELFA
jgi:hypothetical protein